MRPTILYTAALIALLGCIPANESNRTTAVSEDGSFNFIDVDPMTRGTQFMTVDPIVELTDYTRLHDSTVEFYELDSDTDFMLLNDLQDFKDLKNFTNIQEAVNKTDFYQSIRRGCDELGLSPVKACLDQMIRSSGAIVFKSTTTGCADHDSNACIDDVFHNTMGALPVNVEANAHNGSTQAMTVACISCHNSTYTKESYTTGKRMLFVDGRGDNSYADPLTTGPLLDWFNEAYSHLGVNGVPDPEVAASARGRLAGLVADQTNRIRQNNIDQFPYLADSYVEDYIKAMNAETGVSTGWLAAFGSMGSGSANATCWGFGGVENEAYDCDQDFSDSAMASRTARPYITKLIHNETVGFTGERNAISLALANTVPLDQIPLRKMRAVSWLPTNGTGGSIGYGVADNLSFYLPYLDMDDMADFSDAVQIAQGYLAAATAVSSAFPEWYDRDLVSKWLGGKTSTASAKQQVEQKLTRRVMRGYQETSQRYHFLRFSQPLKIPADYRVHMTVAELQTGASYVNETCATCHVRQNYFPYTGTSYSTWWNQCDLVGSDCEIWDETLVDVTTTVDTFKTPTAKFAEGTMGAIRAQGTTSTGRSSLGITAVFNNAPGVVANDDIRSNPVRITQNRTQSLTKWGYTSFEDALKENPPQHSYAILSPHIDDEGRTLVRRAYSSVDIDGGGLNNTGGLERLICLVSDPTCKEKLEVHGHPREINGGKTADPWKTHLDNGVDGPIIGEGFTIDLPSAADRKAVSKYLRTLSDGGVTVLHNGYKTPVHYMLDDSGIEGGDGPGDGPDDGGTQSQDDGGAAKSGGGANAM